MDGIFSPFNFLNKDPSFTIQFNWRILLYFDFGRGYPPDSSCALWIANVLFRITRGLKKTCIEAVCMWIKLI